MLNFFFADKMLGTFALQKFLTFFQQNFGSVSAYNTFENIMPRQLMTSLVLKQPGPEVIKLFSCSTQLSMNFFLLINVKMPTIVGILTFMSRKNSILDLSEPK